MLYSNSINFNRFKLSYLWRTFTLLSIYYLNLFNVTFNLYLMQWFPNQLNWIKYICITHNNLWSQLLITINKFIIYNPIIAILYIYELTNSIFPFRFPILNLLLSVFTPFQQVGIPFLLYNHFPIHFYY